MEILNRIMQGIVIMTHEHNYFSPITSYMKHHHCTLKCAMSKTQMLPYSVNVNVSERNYKLKLQLIFPCIYCNIYLHKWLWLNIQSEQPIIAKCVRITNILDGFRNAV